MSAAAPAAVPAVSPEHRWLFDLQGFLLLRGVLGAGEVAELLAAVHRLEATEFDDDAWRSRLSPDNARGVLATCQREPSFRRLNGLLRLDPAFDRLIDHPAVLPYLRAFVGSPQLINTWSISKDAGKDHAAWHRGASTMQYWCRDGQIRTQMLNVVWFLTDNGPDDGCMCAVPGSHKSDVAMRGGYDPQAVVPGAADFDYPRHRGLDLPGSVPITGRAGDVLVFSESLIHDGLRKTTPGTRTNLYFNHVASILSVAGHEPQNMRHFLMPRAARERLTPARRALVRWMDYARYEIDE